MTAEQVMPGNIYHAFIHSTEIDPGSGAMNAILALAFEQRTANLIAYAVHNSTALAEGVDVDIRERLGMEVIP